jgi:hypothetical protein
MEYALDVYNDIEYGKLRLDIVQKLAHDGREEVMMRVSVRARGIVTLSFFRLIPGCFDRLTRHLPPLVRRVPSGGMRTRPSAKR